MRDCERFSYPNRSLYRGAIGGLIIYDIANKETFKSLSARIKFFLEYSSKQVNLVLVGNKCDLAA